jgi:predicted amino acid dehydrogenase
MGITTGNTYALRLALQAIQRTEQELDRPQEDSILAVVGATGNIGRAAAEMLAPLYRETLLVGRNSPSARRRLEALSGCLPRTRVATELGCARQADVVLVAMNAVDRPLQPAHFKLHAIVCDVSVPAALAASTRALRPDLRLMHGGIAGLPGGEDLQIVGFPLPAGQVYGCMAEAMLLGFEGVRDSRFTGSIRSDQLRVLEAMAQRHGFELADRKSFQTVSAELKEECYAFG